MRLERVRPTLVRVTLHPLELATLVSAARLVADSAGRDDPTMGPLPPGLLVHLRQVLAGYDAAMRAGPQAGPEDPDDIATAG